MSDPITISYGPWAPDLQNIASEVTGASGTVPCADVLNVYYQDGAFRCLPSPSSLGGAAPTPVLCAFSYYDNVAGQQLVFEGMPQAVYTLIDGVPTIVPVETLVTVAATPLTMAMGLGGTNQAGHLGLTMSLGTIVAKGGNLYNGTLVAGYNSANNLTNYGYIAATIGSLTPTKDANGNTITEIVYLQRVLPAGGYSYSTILKMQGSLPQNYFTLLSSSGINLASNIATYTVSGGVTTWVWPNSSLLFSAGFTYTIKISA